ncbi:MAG TPA: CocE/NonD family hydrolase, partial [Vicinamibacteria bacterium]|nr:CocE/NonD family hydrolase [Vicinamibacteria bacterium]
GDLFMPSGGPEGERFPVLLEYLPYRKGEASARNHGLYSYFVERGYVVARVDIRGMGNSEGSLIAYEYTDQEQEDGEVVIDWLSKQSWSSGAVGMFGISWGGFNSIHMAMRNPPALKAILAVDATDDLYQDDVHYMDGILHLDSWEMSQDLDNARPGPPDYVIDEANFRDRFDTEPWMMTYKRQQRDGPFWDRTALKARYDSIRIPSFVIGGWYDGYRDSVPRMLEHVSAPTKAIMGPWSHAFPHNAYPKPQFEWRHEAVRWFDHWLKGKDTGILDEPRFAVFIRDWHPPGPFLEEVPGQWRWEDGWPIARIRERAFYPQGNHVLSHSRATSVSNHQLRYVPWVGMEAGGPVMWWGDVAHDQRPTDAYSLVYDSEPLDEAMEILGLPRALLKVSADARHANWFVRLSDVAPDGTVTQVAGAGFNGTHRESAKEPKWIEPGVPFPLEIEMHFTSWVFPAGHRIRVSISNAQWPMFWPTPYPMTTSLQIGGEDGARILLPVVPHEDRPRPAFLPATATSSLPGYESLDDGTSSGYGEVSSFERNPQTGVVKVVATNSGATRYPWGIERYRESITHQTEEDHPERTSMLGEHRMTLELDGRTLVWEAELTFRSDLDNFYYTYTRRLFENGALMRQKVWNDTIPRDHQ